MVHPELQVSVQAPGSAGESTRSEETVDEEPAHRYQRHVSREVGRGHHRRISLPCRPGLVAVTGTRTAHREPRRSGVLATHVATAGANPAKLSYLHRGFAFAAGAPVRQSVTGTEYQAWAKTQGITVTPGKFGTGLAWDGDDRDLTTIHNLIFKSTPTWGIRTRSNFPAQERIPYPVTLTREQMVAYEVAWAEFQESLAQIDAKRTVTGAKQSGIAWLAAMVRYRQKAGLLRAAGTSDLVVEMLANGKQVAVGCEYSGTVEAIAENLAKHRITPALFTGQNPNTREDERIAYQRGEREVIIFTPVEGFSLHAGDTLAGGNDVPRVTVIAEPRWSPYKSLQAEGRSQRNGTERRSGIRSLRERSKTG